MTLKTRLTILLLLVFLFLVVTPYLVLYSLGYRIDFKNQKIVATGGIYVRVQPSTANITIDNKINDATGVFSNSIFVQNLLPGEHSVSIKKDGYHDYQKNLLVKEKAVTKLENVILFGKNIPFEILDSTTQFSLLKQKPIERFIILNNNLYYFDNAPENVQLTALQRNTPIIKNVLAFKSSGNNIIWLGLDGFLKSFNINTSTTENISEVALKTNTKRAYELEIFSQNIFLKEGSNLLLFNQETKSFENFYSPVKDLKISSDGQKIIYFNDNAIFIYYLNKNLPTNGEGQNKILLQKSVGKITDLYWLNNDYIIFNSGNKINISEIDTRGNINTLSLAESISLPEGKSIKIEKPEIFFEKQNRNLYILAQNQLIYSDRILP
ncbi:MAG: PEGA domain-containing protein [Patescibacteria group bacterium]